MSKALNLRAVANRKQRNKRSKKSAVAELLSDMAKKMEEDRNLIDAVHRAGRVDIDEGGDWVLVILLWVFMAIFGTLPFVVYGG